MTRKAKGHPVTADYTVWTVELNREELMIIIDGIRNHRINRAKLTLQNMRARRDRGSKQTKHVKKQHEMKHEFYPESSIREQIEAGGAEDWQIRMGGYVVSLYYTKSPKSGIARIVPFRRADRLSVIVYRRLPDGTKEAVRQIKVPARNANLWTDHRNSLRIVAHDGRMCIFSVTASGGPEFLGGKWGRIASDDPISDEERKRGITRATERWVSMKNE